MFRWYWEMCGGRKRKYRQKKATIETRRKSNGMKNVWQFVDRMQGSGRYIYVYDWIVLFNKKRKHAINAPASCYFSTLVWGYVSNWLSVWIGVQLFIQTKDVRYYYIMIMIAVYWYHHHHHNDIYFLLMIVRPFVSMAMHRKLCEKHSHYHLLHFLIVINSHRSVQSY